MESPFSWTRAHNIICRARAKHHKDTYDLQLVGGSCESLIVRMLKEAGFLTPEALEIVGYQDDKDTPIQPYKEGF